MVDETISLEKYFDNRIDSVHNSVSDNIMHLNAKMDLINKLNETAIKKAEETVNTRLEGMNEFRAAMKDQANKFASKDEIDRSVNSLDDRIKLLELDRAKLEGMASQTTVIIFGGITIVSFLLTVITFFTK